MKTLVTKVNASITDPTAQEFGISTLKVDIVSRTIDYFEIQFESLYEDVIIEYDAPIRFYIGTETTARTRFNDSTLVSEGIYTVPKSTSIERLSRGGVYLWFPTNGRTSVDITIHRAYKLGGITHTTAAINSTNPDDAGGYGRIKPYINMLDFMSITKLVVGLYAQLRMEDKTFDMRNLQYFEKLDYFVVGTFSATNVMWLPKKTDADFDIRHFQISGATLVVDNDSFNRVFETLWLQPAVPLYGTVTTLGNFKAKYLTVETAETADTFANLLYATAAPFLTGCEVKLLVSSAISEEIKTNLTAKATAVGGTITFTNA